jgi:DNA-binding transcriptional ArsR family regulator
MEPRLLWYDANPPGMPGTPDSPDGSPYDREIPWPKTQADARWVALNGPRLDAHVNGIFRWGHYLVTLGMKDVEGRLETSEFTVYLIPTKSRPRPPADSVMKRGLPIESMERVLGQKYVEKLEEIARTRFVEWDENPDREQSWRDTFGEPAARALQNVKARQGTRRGRGRAELSAEELAETLRYYQEAKRIKPEGGLREFMGRKLGITPDTVSKRIRRLRDEGLIPETPAKRKGR